MSDPKTNNPVPLWYEVVATFSDDDEPCVEAWNEEKYANLAAEAWKRIERIDREQHGLNYTVAVTVTPKYTPKEK